MLILELTQKPIWIVFKIPFNIWFQPIKIKLTEVIFILDPEQAYLEPNAPVNGTCIEEVNTLGYRGSTIARDSSLVLKFSLASRKHLTPLKSLKRENRLTAALPERRWSLFIEYMYWLLHQKHEQFTASILKCPRRIFNVEWQSKRNLEYTQV